MSNLHFMYFFVAYLSWLLYGLIIFIALMPDELSEKISLGLRLIPHLLGATLSWIFHIGFTSFYVQWEYKENVYQIKFNALFFRGEDDYFK